MISFTYDRNDREFDISSRIKKGLKYANIKLKSDVVSKTPVDTGNLKGSITSAIKTSGNVYTGTVGTNLNYAGYVNAGTGPHKKSTGSSDFIESIKDWASRHGINNPWGVITSIRKKGTKAQKNFEVTSKIERNVKAAFKKGFKA